MSDLIDAALPEVSEEGVDLTLVRAMLDRTPLERLEALAAAVRSIRDLASGRWQR